MSAKEKYYDKFTKYGKFMYDFCEAGTKFLVKHKALYYILAHTWGLLMTLIGYLITLVLLIVNLILKLCEKEPLPLNKHYWVYYFNIGKSWGGMEMGTMFLTDRNDHSSTKKHEFGHTFQNCLLGPLFPFLVAIPSATRYWIQEIRWRKGKGSLNKPYDSIWFEGSATDLGTIAQNYIDNN